MMTDISEVDFLLKKMGELEVQAASLRGQREALNNEGRKWLDRRNSLNSMRRKIQGEINLYRDKRDQVNLAVKSMKKDQEELFSQIYAKKREFTELTKKVNLILSKTDSNGDEINRRIKELDWKIQTNPLTPGEEAEIINRIRRLEEELSIHREALKLENERRRLLSELKGLEDRINTVNGEKAECVDKSRFYHKKMVERIEEANRLKSEGDRAHVKFVEFREAAKEVHSRLLEAATQIRSVNLKIRVIEEENRGKNLEKIVEARSREACEKLKDRRKLTLEEYKILRGKGLV
jgi:uncharacterized coiled-coil DUF342 family protein